MTYIGNKPTAVPLTSADIEDGVVSAADLGANSVDSSELVDGSIDTSHLSDNAITLAKMASGTDGNIISYDASGNPVAIATGNDGQVLTSTGAGSPPAFEAAPSGAMTYIGGEQTAGAQSAVNINGCFSDTYVAYYCLFSGAATQATSSSPIVKFKDTSDSVLNGDDYKYAGYEHTGGSGGAGAYFYHDAEGFMPMHTSSMGNSSNLPWDIHMWFGDMTASGHKPTMTWIASGFFHGYDFGTTSGGGGYDVETAVGGLQFSMNGGNIRECNIRVWGRKA